MHNEVIYFNFYHIENLMEHISFVNKKNNVFGGFQTSRRLHNSHAVFIGGLALDGNPRGGENMKNKLLLERLSELNIHPRVVNTTQWRKRPWCLIKMIWVLLASDRNTPIVLSASHASGKLIKIIPLLTTPNNVIYWSVGGDLDRRVNKKEFSIESLNKLRTVIVQGRKQAQALKLFGLTNVISVPNSKPIPKMDLTHQHDFKGKFVYVSRIHPQKGVREIIEAVRVVEEKLPFASFSVDFYGGIENSFKNEFETLIEGSNKCNYKGYLNLINIEGYKKLSSYDCFLFPTYWPGEGFPGAIIDAYIAGLPIIATKWNLNEEMIIDNQTGFLIPVKNVNVLANRMIDIINETEAYSGMRERCYEEAMKYDVKKVLSEDLFHELGII